MFFTNRIVCLLLVIICLNYVESTEMLLRMKVEKSVYDDMESLFWKISDPQQPEYYAKYLSHEDFNQLLGVSDSAVNNVIEWFEKNSENCVASELPIRDYMKVECEEKSFYKLIKNHELTSVKFQEFLRIPSELEEYVDYMIPKYIRKEKNLVVTERNSRFVALEEQVEINDPDTQKQYYNMPTNLVGTNATNSQMVYGTGTYGFSYTDLEDFYSKWNIPTNSSHVDTIGMDGKRGGANYGECSLDVQQISSFAPQVQTYSINNDNSSNAEAGTGFGTALLDFLVDLNNEKSIPYVFSLSLGSLSWGSCNLMCTQASQQGVSTYSDCINFVQGQFQVCMYNSSDIVSQIDTQLMKLGLQGVSVFVAAGDGGSHFSFGPFAPTSPLARALNEISCNYTLPTYPSASPYITSIGGSQIKGGKPIGCQWNEGGGITAGCGFALQSDLKMPSYQESFVKNYLSTGNETVFGNYNNAGRAYPDFVSISADVPITQSGFTEIAGGTSASTPVCAGVFSILNDIRLNKGLPPLGFINTRLYQSYPNNSDMFTDITEGTSSCGIGKCCETGFYASKGYDVFTGFGQISYPALERVFTTDN